MTREMLVLLDVLEMMDQMVYLDLVDPLDLLENLDSPVLKVMPEFLLRASHLPLEPQENLEMLVCSIMQTNLN